MNLAALAILNWDNFKYAEMIYDKVIAPLYKDNQESIQKCSDVIEKLFEKNSEALKSKVANTAGESTHYQILRNKGVYGRSTCWSAQPLRAEKEIGERGEG